MEICWAQNGNCSVRCCRLSGDVERDWRTFLNDMLDVLRVGCLWRDMHARYDKWNSAHVRFRRWTIRAATATGFGTICSCVAFYR